MCTESTAGMRDAVAVFVGGQMSGNVRNLAWVLQCKGVWLTTLVHTSLSIAAEFGAWQLQSTIEYACCRRRIHNASTREALDRFRNRHSAANTQSY